MTAQDSNAGGIVSQSSADWRIPVSLVRETCPGFVKPSIEDPFKLETMS